MVRRETKLLYQGRYSDEFKLFFLFIFKVFMQSENFTGTDAVTGGCTWERKQVDEHGWNMRQ